MEVARLCIVEVVQVSSHNRLRALVDRSLGGVAYGWIWLVSGAAYLHLGSGLALLGALSRLRKLCLALIADLLALLFPLGRSEQPTKAAHQKKTVSGPSYLGR